MFDNQLEKLKNSKFEISNDILIITCDKYLLERFKQSKMEIQQKFKVGIYPKKDQIKIKGNEVKRKTFCDVLNFAFDLNEPNSLTLDQFNELLSKTTTEDNIIKKRRSSTTLPQINNIIPKAGSTSILSRKFSDLGEIPEPIELEENSRSNSCLYSPSSTPIAMLSSEKDDHKAKPTEFVPQKVTQSCVSNTDQLSLNDFNNAIKSQPASPKRDQKQNQSNYSYKSRNQNKFVYYNNKKLERRSTVPNCQEFSPKTKVDNNNNSMKQSYNQKNSQNKTAKNAYSQKNKNSFYSSKNRSQTISFYSSNNIKNQKSDESSDSICTEPETTNDTSVSFNYSPRSYSPSLNPIIPSIVNSYSTNTLLNDFQPNKNFSSNVEYKLTENKLICVITENPISNNSNNRSAKEILQKVYQTLGFNSQASFNKIIFKC